MPRFCELDEEFVCPHRNGCPYLEGLPTGMVWNRYQNVQGTECQYEHIIQELNGELDQEHRRNRELQRENQQLKTQLAARTAASSKAAGTPWRPSPTNRPRKRKSVAPPKAIPPGNAPSPIMSTRPSRLMHP